MRTLADVAADPGSATTTLVLATGRMLVLRPLEAGDGTDLAVFFEALSPQSRRYGGVFGDTAVLALEHCQAIGRYDKLRLVICAPGQRIVGLLELSFDVVATDVERFRGYGIDLGPADGRFGLCLADDLHGTGAAALASTATFDVARAFGPTRLILWGGVLDDNVRARRFYERLGFTELGSWREPTGHLVHDGLIDL